MKKRDKIKHIVEAKGKVYIEKLSKREIDYIAKCAKESFKPNDNILKRLLKFGYISDVINYNIVEVLILINKNKGFDICH